MDDRSTDESRYLLRGERDVIRLRNPTEDIRGRRMLDLTSADLSDLFTDPAQELGGKEETGLSG